MRFEFNPTLTLTKEEFTTLDNALKLCRDMDVVTTFDAEKCYRGETGGCDLCPKRLTCNRLAKECVFTVAHKALKEIIDIAIVK